MAAQRTAVIKIKQLSSLLESVCFTLLETVVQDDLCKCGSCRNVALKPVDDIRADALTLNLSHLISSKQFPALIKRKQCSITQENIRARSRSEGFMLGFHTLRGSTLFMPSRDTSVVSTMLRPTNLQGVERRHLLFPLENKDFSVFSELKSSFFYLLTVLPLSPCSRAPR